MLDAVRNVDRSPNDNMDVTLETTPRATTAARGGKSAELLFVETATRDSLCRVGVQCKIEAIDRNLQM